MAFDPVDSRQSFPDLEKGILQYWKEEDVFQRSIKKYCVPGDVLDHHGQKGCGSEIFSFYDGPPFATGLPHYGHLLAGTIKDVIPRYQTMRGKKVERRFGWDCHGLPVENLVEKEQELKSKMDIEAKGIRWFNDQCRLSVQRYTEEWRTTVERMGRWVDMDHDYRTMDPEYMESIWWVFAELYRKGLIYEGKKSMHVCPRCVTPLSNFEVTLGYKDVADWTTVTIFPLTHDANTALLAWTTTSWTLPGNLFLAVGPNFSYAKVSVEGDQHTYIVAEKRVENVFKGKEYRVIGSISAQELIGKTYEPLFPYFAEEYKKQNAFRVVAGDFVTTEDGTGIVHIAPGFGDDDYAVGKREGVEVLSHVGMDGRFIDAVTDFVGMEVKPFDSAPHFALRATRGRQGKPDDPTKTDKSIAVYLKDHGRLFDQYSYTHSYPHCWRCDSPLINYATSSWFVAIDTIKKDLLAQNAKTNWVPEHIRDGRFGEWLKNARDWAISRNRYWGTPLPIWRCEETGEIEIIGSRDALMRKCPFRFTKLTVLRHAESEGNLTPIYQGCDPGTDLTEKGRGQAEETARQLSSSEAPRGAESRGLFNRVISRFVRPRSARAHSLEKSAPISLIYSSPLARTRQTAAIIAKRTGANIVIDERLREVHFGAWEGKTVDFSDLTFVKERRAHKIEKGRPESIYHFEGMETWESVQDRIKQFMNDVLPNHRGEHIVVVTHADPVINIKHFFTKQDPLKLSHQPYPQKAYPYTYFFDHERQAELDLHRDTVDELIWKSAQGGTMRRVSDVLDCWFESGSMPYAQSHYPFERDVVGAPRCGARVRQRHAPTNPPGFPADFIAEGLDQTRGWFYTLMVLSTALFQKPAFKNCIVNGIVLAEDGKKMSKRLKNYPEPDLVMNKYGADAMRFTLMASPAVRGESLRFSEKAVEETVRRVILPLWNSYSFFVLHANEAQWETSECHGEPFDKTQDRLRRTMTRSTSPFDYAQGDTSSHSLDQWIRAEVQDLVNRMTKELDRYDLSATCAELYETLDALTNWYVRRSRRRFAGKEGDAERRVALSTLYDVLLTFSKLLAPFCPFITDAIYLNLVPNEHGSIHLTEWPAVRELTKAERESIEKTRLLRTIVSLGMGLRAEAKVKVRQPLSKIELALPFNHQTSQFSSEEAEILKQELNVKEVRVISDASYLADRIVQVDARKAGPRLGGKVQEIIRAAKAGEFTENTDGTITVLGEKLSKEEAPIIYRGREGQAVASQKGIVVALDTSIIAELKLEGLARDIIRSVQALRREKGLQVSDHIRLVAGEGTEEVLTKFKEIIEKETNGSFANEGVITVKISFRDEEVMAEVV